jgi:hypothetical protein
MTDTETLMRQWLETGTPEQRTHARNRLAIGFGPAPTLPPLLTRAANFAGAIASHVAAGMPTLDAEAVAERLAVCHACPKFVAPNSCSVCGCNLSAKAAWADQDCPERLWPPAPKDAP